MEAIGSKACECIWTCARGRTRLACELWLCGSEIELQVVRNSRLYGLYRFAERPAALTFAARLRDTFASNGWTAVVNN